MTPVRAALVVLLMLAAPIAAGGVLALGRDPAGAPGADRASEVDSVGARASRDPAVAALSTWDRRRADAWQRGDRVALRRLYVARSLAGRHDLAMLEQWRDQGLVVAGMRTQLLNARVVVRRHNTLVVAVTERLVRATAVGPGTRIRLPVSSPARREVTLRRLDGRWRVAAVRAG